MAAYATTRIDFRTILDQLYRGEILDEINITFRDVQDADALELAAALTANFNVMYLRIRNPNRIPVLGAAALGRAIRHADSRIWGLDRYKSGGASSSSSPLRQRRKAIQSFIREVRQSNTLQSLSLVRQDLTCSCQDLRLLLHQTRTLTRRKLSLVSGVNDGTTDLQQVRQGFAENSSLRRLDLGRKSAEWVESILHGIERHPSLERVSIGIKKESMDVVVVLQDFLARHPSVPCLKLDRPPAGSLIPICQSLRWNSSIRTFQIHGCAIGREDASGLKFL